MDTSNTIKNLEGITQIHEQQHPPSFPLCPGSGLLVRWLCSPSGLPENLLQPGIWRYQDPLTNIHRAPLHRPQALCSDAGMDGTVPIMVVLQERHMPQG